MDTSIQYISYDDALRIYHRLIDASEGGLRGVREEGSIHATLEFVRNDDYYPSFAHKLAYIVYTFCSGHYFYDGNKRIALTLGAYFLHCNSFHWQACIFMRHLEAIVYHVAASHIDYELLLRIISSFMKGEDHDEALKLAIAHAMSQGQSGSNDTPPGPLPGDL